MSAAAPGIEKWDPARYPDLGMLRRTPGDLRGDGGPYLRGRCVIRLLLTDAPVDDVEAVTVEVGAVTAHHLDLGWVMVAFSRALQEADLGLKSGTLQELVGRISLQGRSLCVST